MIKWISANNPPKECSYKEYLVTVEYNGNRNINGRKTMCMSYEERGRKHIPTWCWNGSISIWKVLYWAELPDPCQE